MTNAIIVTGSILTLVLAFMLGVRWAIVKICHKWEDNDAKRIHKEK